MEVAGHSITQVVWEYQDIIPNAEFVAELLEVILKKSPMTFDGVIIGTNIAKS